MSQNTFQGSLFSNDFLTESITRLVDWTAIDDANVTELKRTLEGIYAAFPTAQTPNESQTEDDLIWRVLAALGWESHLRQQNLAARGRDDVPDGLLFKDTATKAQANSHPEEWRRYGLGLAIVESKRWQRPLDRRSGRRGEETAPSSQMLRYLRRVEDLTTGKLRWGILTNGNQWRLYYQGARSVSEQFFEISLPSILGITGFNEGLFALTAEQRTHWLRVFYLQFRKEAFLGTPSDERTFHQRALEEGKFYEEHVANNLSEVVFQKVFPELAKNIAASAADASLQEVREAALILLYRLLFILYAEDRNLLPVTDSRYDDYGLRVRVRGDVGERKDRNDVFSTTAARYWAIIDDLCRAIAGGDQSIGLPPYNGGLFDASRTQLLAEVRLPDSVMAEVIDALSFEVTDGRRKYINYRDLSVQQLGSIYERLLEHEIVRTQAEILIRPNIFARKNSGSYYTPDDLVSLIIREAVEPLITPRIDVFRAKAEELASDAQAEDRKLGILKRLDPAEKLLELKICDPAMGSGHFLVSLVDYLADQVITAMAEAESSVTWGDYVSPLSDRIDSIRNTIRGNAEDRGWTIEADQLDDRHIVRRMILKKCIYGVDKNPMAVELAKVSLWLHTFTVGAPLSFLDHHMLCGDSLFGNWVKKGIDKATLFGTPLLLHGPLTRSLRAASSMQIIEGLTDAEIAEAHRSADVYAEVQEMTAPLSSFLSLMHAFEWLGLRAREDKDALRAFFDGVFGDPVQIAQGGAMRPNARPEGVRFAEILLKARELVEEERFLNWQVSFPGVWTDWQNEGLTGGFDAVIGNPPWDRMKLQQVEWFAARKREIAMATRASDRNRMVEALVASNDPLAADFEKADSRAEASVKMAGACGDYPLLSGGDVNLYSLFVERAMRLVKPNGMVGLLTPSGIASDKTAAPFFKGVSTEGRLKALYDFENKKVFFPDVHASFKFCTFVASPSPIGRAAKCAFYLHSVKELDDPERCFPLTAADFATVNPNTGTAPIFRSRKDANLTTRIFGRVPVLVNSSSGQDVKSWPVKYKTLFHMTNASDLFRTKTELEEQEGAYAIDFNIWRDATSEWLPLYEGKMVQAYDHRAASIVINPNNQHRPAQPEAATIEQHEDPNWYPTPQYWVRATECGWSPSINWVLGFKEITAATNERTFIAAILPPVAFGNKIPLFLPEGATRDEFLLCANFNSIPFDFVCRQKIQGQTLNLFIVEQTPVIPPDAYNTVRFGRKTAREVVAEAVLELTYTAHDMAPFAKEMGYVNNRGEVKPPFAWEDEKRLNLRAKLDAVFFILYGLTDRDDIRYIYSTFPNVERDEINIYGRYQSRDLCLAWVNALSAGNPDAELRLTG